MALEPRYHAGGRGGDDGTRSCAEPIPPLCTLVGASPFDAALHDAFGKVHGLNCYHTYGPDFMTHDLGHYLGAEFAGEHARPLRAQASRSRGCRCITWSGRSIRSTTPTSRSRIGDGLPETLAEWIRFNGLTHLKIKLNGDDLGWDVERVVRVDRVAEETQRQRGVDDAGATRSTSTRRCPNVGYLLEFLRQRARSERRPASSASSTSSSRRPAT